MLRTHLLRTKIVCTIGPACRPPAILRLLIEGGLDVTRLNLSHGDWATHREDIHLIRRLAAELGKPVAILCDLQGPKLRLGRLPAGGVRIAAGEPVTLTTSQVEGEPGRVPVQYEGLPACVSPGDRILIDDGLVELQVVATTSAEIHTQVIAGSVLHSNKGLNLPRASLAIPAITAKDREDLVFALGEGVDWIALSFVRLADEVLELKGLIREQSPQGYPTPVIAKIEKPEAVQNIDSIIAVADGIMVARGDLGVETSPEAVPMVQKMIIQRCNRSGKPVITATQMLESMMRNPRPTRAEASDVANAILDGSDAIMLSGETAAGDYPAESVRTMVRIACEVERAQVDGNRQWSAAAGRGLAEAMAHASVETAIDVSAAAIIATTLSGHTARSVAAFRPPCPIVAVTPSPQVQRGLMLSWGVYPLIAERASTTDQVIANAVEVAKLHGYVKEGEIAVVTGGSVESGVGTTNIMKVHLVERVLVRGAGLGARRVSGRVRRLEAPLPASLRVEPGEIIVTSRADSSFVPALRGAAGLVTVAEQADPQCRSLALEMGLPTLFGEQQVLGSLSDGQEVILDALRGVVYEQPRASGPFVAARGVPPCET